MAHLACTNGRQVHISKLSDLGLLLFKHQLQVILLATASVNGTSVNGTQLVSDMPPCSHLVVLLCPSYGCRIWQTESIARESLHHAFAAAVEDPPLKLLRTARRLGFTRAVAQIAMRVTWLQMMGGLLTLSYA